MEFPKNSIITFKPGTIELDFSKIEKVVLGNIGDEKITFKEYLKEVKVHRPVNSYLEAYNFIKGFINFLESLNFDESEDSKKKVENRIAIDKKAAQLIKDTYLV